MAEEELLVRVVSAEEVLAIRWPVLRAGFPREAAIFPGDTDAATRHFGIGRGEELLGVASVYLAPLATRPEWQPAWQLRGMAVLEKARLQHCGSKLLAHSKAYVGGQDAAILWCNARTQAASFYLRRGFRVIGGEFEIPTVGPHFRMYYELPR